MSEYYHIVPWFDSNEWRDVFNKIYSNTSSLLSKEKALERLYIWKARCPSLPAGIESTLGLLEVNIQDSKNSTVLVSDQLLRLAYSSAIMRFVNHMLDSETAKGNSLYHAAKSLNIPDWIVDLRHNTAHSDNLPTIELFREANLIGLNWLKTHYWEKYMEHIHDYIAGAQNDKIADENEINILINLYISLSICAHPHCRIENLAEIPDTCIRESIINDARDLLGENINFSNLKAVSLTSLIKTANTKWKKLLKNDNISHVYKALLGDDSIFLSIELLDFLVGTDFDKITRLPKHYVQCFELFLTFLHTNNVIMGFVLELFQITQQNQSDAKTNKLAALWVSEILKALKKSKLFITRMTECLPEKQHKRTKSELKQLFGHWFPNEKYGLILDLYTNVPEELTDINYIKPIISTYNPYLTNFIKDLLDLLEPKLPTITAKQICKLAHLIASPERVSVLDTKIYTIHDLKCKQDSSIHHNIKSDDSDCIEIDDQSLKMKTTQNNTNNTLENSIWKLALTDHRWSTTPIGRLPQQIPDPVPMEL